MLQLYAAALFSNPMDFDQCSRVVFEFPDKLMARRPHPGVLPAFEVSPASRLEITAIPPAGAPAHSTSQ